MCDTCDWENLIERIDEMLDDDDRYSFAEDTLLGIRDWVEEHEHCTGNQETAVDNIENGARD